MACMVEDIGVKPLMYPFWCHMVTSLSKCLATSAYTFICIIFIQVSFSTLYSRRMQLKEAVTRNLLKGKSVLVISEEDSSNNMPRRRGSTASGAAAVTLTASAN